MGNVAFNYRKTKKHTLITFLHLNNHINYLMQNSLTKARKTAWVAISYNSSNSKHHTPNGVDIITHVRKYNVMIHVSKAL